MKKVITPQQDQPKLYLGAIQSSIVQTLLYFETFKHPLTIEELTFFSNPGAKVNEIEEACAFLLSEEIVNHHQSYYFLDLDEASVVRRVKAEAHYENMMEKANRYSRIISSFPFIESVCISGSMSKGVAYEGGDIDYFIITKANRLWVTRFLLTLFKKTLLIGSNKHFCLNYFLDVDHLPLNERNLFTATELATVMPMYGQAEYDNLIKQNNWLSDYYPNFKMRKAKGDLRPAWPWFKKTAEFLFDNGIGEFLGNTFMKMVRRKCNRKAGNIYSKEELAIMFKTKKHVSKVHYGNHQRRLLDSVAKKRQQFIDLHKLKLIDTH